MMVRFSLYNITRKQRIFIAVVASAIAAIVIAAISVCCSHHIYPRELIVADSLCESNPEKALLYIKKLKPEVSSWDEEDAWYYRLLCIKANDKLYIPHTSDKEISEIVRHYEHNSDSQLLPVAYYYAGSVYRDMGETPKSLEYFKKAIEANKCDSHKAMLSNAYSQCGFIFLSQGLYEEALVAFNESGEIDKETGDTMKHIYTIKNISNTYRLKGDLKQSLKYMNIAYNEAIKTSDSMLVDDITSQLAACYLEKKDYRKAESIINKRIKNISAQYRNIYNSITSQIAYEKGRYNEAEEKCRVLLHTGDIYQKQYASRVLAEINTTRKDYRNSVLLWKEHAFFSDSIDRMTDSETLARINNLYNQRKYENDILNNKIEIANRNLIICISFAVLLFGIIAFIWFFKTTKKKHEAQIEVYKHVDTLLRKQVAASKETLSQNKIEISRLSDLIKDLSATNSMLEDSNKRVIEENKSLLAKYESEREKLLLLTEKIEKEKLYKESTLNLLHGSSIYMNVLQCAKSGKMLCKKDQIILTETFNELYPSFHENIMAIYKLSDYEFIVCILIKLGFSNNDISVLLSKTAGAISHTRKRLYQKMFKGHGSSNDFDKFVKSI